MSATPPPFVTVAEASHESPPVLTFPHNVFDPLSMPFFMPPSQPVSKNLSQTVSMKERMKLFREQKGTKEDQAVSAKDMEEFLAAVDTTSSSPFTYPTFFSFFSFFVCRFPSSSVQASTAYSLTLTPIKINPNASSLSSPKANASSSSSSSSSSSRLLL